MPIARRLAPLLLLVALASVALADGPAHRARFCGFGGDKALLQGLKALWPDLEYCRAFDEGQAANMKDLAQACRELGIVFSVQSCAPAMPAGYLEQNKCWAVDFLGRRPVDLGFTHPVVDYCNPASVAALKRNLDVAIKQVGAKSFTMVDFVWPYIGGRWGYSEADFAAYRAALKGTDGGLRIRDANGDRTLGFRDYFAELSGLRLKPEDVGCASWDVYTPARSPEVEQHPTDQNRRSFFLYHALYHYCWLRYAQECGEYAQSLGGELQASLNPENIGNGGDLLTWGRLRGTGEPWLEQWGPAWTAIADYHNLPYFARAYRQSGKRLGLIGETGAAGGHPDSGFGPARPHYWDPQSNYAITYAVGAAAGFDDREEDYFYTSLDETRDPGTQHYDCWRGYVTAMNGFVQYGRDAARRPHSDVVHITNRSILHYADNSDYSTNQPYSLSQALIEQHYDYEAGFFPLEKSVLAQYKVVLFSPWDYPRDFAPVLRDWLDAAPGRVLVTHSFVPTRPCKGLYQSPVTALDEPLAAGVFGLTGLRQTDVKAGTITEIAPEWREVFPLPVGTKVSLPLGLVQCEGRALVKLGDQALVTEVKTPRGGTVIYLNFCPPERYKGLDDAHSALVRACTGAVMRRYGLAPQAEGSPQWACARYDLGAGGSAFLLLNQEATGQARFTEETASLAPSEKLWLRLKPDTDYTIYDMLERTTARKRSDAQGRLQVFLIGKNIRLLQVTEAPRR